MCPLTIGDLKQVISGNAPMNVIENTIYFTCVSGNIIILRRWGDKVQQGVMKDGEELFLPYHYEIGGDWGDQELATKLLDRFLVRFTKTRLFKKLPLDHQGDLGCAHDGVLESGLFTDYEFSVENNSYRIKVLGVNQEPIYQTEYSRQVVQDLDWVDTTTTKPITELFMNDIKEALIHKVLLTNRFSSIEIDV